MNKKRMINRKRILNDKKIYNEKRIIDKKAFISLCTVMVCAGLLLTGTTVSAAGESGQFRSKGSIRYQDAGGQEVILDSGDLDVLFQYAAEGKEGLSRALGGVGTKLIREGQAYAYTRDPQTEAAVGQIQTAEQMQEIGFDMLLQALADSQTLPAGYEGTYTLASSDNMTLGRAAWADGSLLRGNNHDLMEHYIRGWIEGSGCTDYEAVYDEEGRWIGYREKQS
ncbi:MAG: hypothetical protein HDR28_04905 [Lachnospiraceae bacterium]|nr:hypothetical protein [Lachnospiraceae bacterium]